MNDAANSILVFAIQEEEAAAEFYTSLAAKMTKPEMAKIFLEFAEEEKRHKAKLIALKNEWQTLPPSAKVADLKIADYAVTVEPSAGMEYKDALVVAMKKEKAAFKLYTDLADTVEEPAAKTLLANLAQEEAKHKLRFEIEFEDTFYVEN